MKSDQPTFACNMSALSPVDRVRHAANTARLMKTLRQVLEEGHGYSFHFDQNSQTILRIAEFVSRERLCCPFFDFTLRVGAASESAVLQVTGPEGVKEFIRLEFGEVIR